MRAKRSLGQNFLKNIGIARKMAALAGVGPGDTVVEVGPGKGMLTRVLLDQASRVIAVEKDDLLFEDLSRSIGHSETFRLEHRDILEADLSLLLPDGAKVVANLPYNIGTQFIIRLVDHAWRIAVVVVMLQREVAGRICARAGDSDYSALSVIVSAGFDASPGFMVGPNNFFPRPKVESQVVRLVPKISPIPAGEMELFKAVVSCAFHQRRKVLGNSLIHLPRIDRELLEGLALRASIDIRRRPQEVSPAQYHLFSKGYGAYLRDHSQGK
ncbi:MAG TPA: 16S rRNA (adenine(1518)-N(6)/adenine(1519)-N(6))-dimethyltransferase RsmA [Deltaproteobacteria bacterium]|mgnify:CR=1 FL=1|jgi:16S rRNA (adenine1518-N6/adenine1519-N6)-dimethyltransferase|nr:ribosomal RNA small subunit methyltransferase A [Deltaproteobacteria bacterium]OQC28957.1 MAG: Ribosomal RNA small subunit methyltransferase A [Deltaproteobacteria bacterium ADurb.Bin072]HRW81225.1 16S rRNA (adenine(1518)-N(6)/adenine(1519)-N(6))-dimethyltransferase RsmA [Desulfomonilia bacterium]HNQ86050.1 16S rRNA (adenine(1518)-N(6)/adenine(1519)-N(6))-dimethyltransferase RsmA [Deltaproteobacteria bacterium]HNS90336.1 16S rRNA (adenine(1518)-N(6)/adenine(1519)-N(6))-dimethyltransferase Rs